MRGRLEPKDTVERFWGLKFIGFPNLSDDNPTTLNFEDLLNLFVCASRVNPGVSPLKHCRFCYKPAKLYRI